MDYNAFEGAAGVGVTVTANQIEAAVAAILDASRDQILEERYHTNAGVLLGRVREKLRWADGKLVKVELDRQMVEMLGERTAADNEVKKKPKEKKAKEPQAAQAVAAPQATQTGAY